MLSFLYVYSDHSILECYNLFSGVELSMRSFFVISAQNLPINSWLQDLTNKAYINVEFGSAISHNGKFDHLVNPVKGSFVSSHEMISIFCQFL